MRREIRRLYRGSASYVAAAPEIAAKKHMRDASYQRLYVVVAYSNISAAMAAGGMPMRLRRIHRVA